MLSGMKLKKFHFRLYIYDIDTILNDRINRFGKLRPNNDNVGKLRILFAEFRNKILTGVRTREYKPLCILSTAPIPILPPGRCRKPLN